MRVTSKYCTILALYCCTQNAFHVMFIINNSTLVGRVPDFAPFVPDTFQLTLKKPYTAISVFEQTQQHAWVNTTAQGARQPPSNGTVGPTTTSLLPSEAIPTTKPTASLAERVAKRRRRRCSAGARAGTGDARQARIINPRAPPRRLATRPLEFHLLLSRRVGRGGRGGGGLAGWADR